MLYRDIFAFDKQYYTVYHKDMKDKVITKKQLEALKIVLDYVERWNKQDEEVKAAEATQILEDIIP